MDASPNMLDELLSELELNHRELSAVLHFLGGRPPALSTLSRAKSSPAPDLVAFLRVLQMSIVRINRSASVEKIPPFARFHATMGDTGDHLADDELSGSRAAYWALILGLARQGVPISLPQPKDIGAGLDQNELAHLLLIQPRTAAVLLRELGYGATKAKGTSKPD